MSKVLITGGGGFIGSHVAEYYAKKNYVDEVIVIDNLSRNKLLNKEIRNYDYNWNYLHQFKKIRFYKKDIRHLKFLKKVLKDNEIDIIIHAAAQTAVTTSIINPLSDFENNIIGTFNILESVRLSKLDPIMILCSTNKVFGNNVNKCELIENDLRYDLINEFSKGISEDFAIDLCEHTPYGNSKLCSDLYFQEYGHIYGLKTGVFRMSCIYGTRQFGIEDQGWIAHFIISAITKKNINIFGNGKQVRDILYISDLINAYDSFVQRVNKIGHDVYCIGGGIDNSLSLLELLNILKAELNIEINYKFFDWRPSDQKIYISNIRKVEEALQWSPKVNPIEGIRKLIEWVKKNKNLFI